MSPQKAKGWYIYQQEAIGVVDPFQLRPDPDNPGKFLLYPPGTYKLRPRPTIEGEVQPPKGFIYIPDELWYCPQCLGVDCLDNEVFESPVYFFKPADLVVTCLSCKWRGRADYLLDFNNAGKEDR